MKQKDKYKHLSFEEKELLFVWFKSQQKWHMRQPPSTWHRNQAKWFGNNASWLFNFYDFSHRTLKANSRELCENIMKNNILLLKLSRRGINK